MDWSAESFAVNTIYIITVEATIPAPHTMKITQQHRVYV